MQYRLRVVSPTGMTLADDSELSKEDLLEELGETLDEFGDSPGTTFQIKSED